MELTYCMAKSSKTETKFEFNKEQRELSRLILERNADGKIVMCKGRAGTGKNFTAIWSCIKKKEDLQHISLYYTRAVVGVDGEDLGFLPGEVNDKFNEYTYPLIDNLNAIAKLSDGVYNVNSLKAQWEAAPIAFFRGRTFDHSMMIIDECQNLSYTQIKTILTRIGQYSTFILLGDPNQIDNPKQRKLKKSRGYCDFECVCNYLNEHNIPLVEMTEVRRSGMSGYLSDLFEELEHQQEI